MRRLPRIIPKCFTLTLVATFAVAAGGGCRPTTDDPQPDTAATSHEQRGLVDRSLVDSCAGFSVQKAATILNVSPSTLDAETGWSSNLNAQFCRYWSAESLIGPGIQFQLDIEPTAAAAAASLRALRENAPAGDAAIRGVVGQPSRQPAVVEFEDIGDEAFWDALTTGVSLRVANVVASIQASASRRVEDNQGGTEIDLERRVAVELARGLREGA